MVLLANEHSAERYSSSLKRLGVPLNGAACRSLNVLPAAPPLPDCSLQPPAAPGGCPNGSDYGASPSSYLAGLYRRVAGRLAAATDAAAADAAGSSAAAASAAGVSIGGGAGSVVLAIDSLTALRCLAGSEQEWDAFLHYVSSLGSRLPVS